MRPFDFLLFPSTKLEEFEKGNKIHDGLQVPLSDFCRKKISHEKRCYDYYKNVRANLPRTWVQCPFGFSSYVFEIDGEKFSVTGLVPFPRMGSSEERDRAKVCPNQKIYRDAVVRNVDAVIDIDGSVQKQVTAEVSRNLAALHEVRKYNRTIRQNLERLCRIDSPADPDLAQTEMVTAWKLSELMSHQFDVLGLIADGNLTALPPKTESKIYRIFDKCVRSLKVVAQQKRIRLSISGDSPKAFISDKTFPIIATVLIDNAIKYGAENTNVTIEIKIIGDDRFRVTVSNLVPKEARFPKNPFEKGSRGDDKINGSGVGLFLAQQVAKQHSTEIQFKRVVSGDELDNVEVYFEMQSIRPHTRKL